MEPAVDVTTLSAPAQKILAPGSPPPLVQLAARGVAPGLKPAEAITVVAILSESTDEKIAETARGTLKKLPAPVLNGALSGDIPPGVIDAFATYYASDMAVMEKVLVLPSILPSTVARIAAMASEPVSELIATNEERLLANPEIIEKLYMNKATRMSTADRLVELAVRNNIELKGIPAYKEAAAAIQQVLIAEPSPEPTFSDQLFVDSISTADEVGFDPETQPSHELDKETGEEVVNPVLERVERSMAEMTVTEKIRMAMIGSASQRALLVRDSNRLVAAAAIRSPAIQEPEVVRISASPAVSDEVLRIIAMDKEWVRSHQIKVNLVMNPRTPFAFSSKLVLHLREHELKNIAKSKQVPGAVQSAAKQQLSRKGQGK